MRIIVDFLDFFGGVLLNDGFLFRMGGVVVVVEMVMVMESERNDEGRRYELDK